MVRSVGRIRDNGAAAHRRMRWYYTKVTGFTTWGLSAGE